MRNTIRPTLNAQRVLNRFFKKVYDPLPYGERQLICEELNASLASISRWRSGQQMPRLSTLDIMWRMGQR